MAQKKTHGKTASGKPITDDLIDQLAKEAEAGYDLNQTLVRREEIAPIEEGLTLDELAVIAKAEHEQCMSVLKTTLEHAVRAGEALLKVRERTTPSGEWTRWLVENFPKHRTTAYSYMRLATYQDVLPPDTSVSAADQLVRGLPAIGGGPPRARVSDLRKADAERMREEGFGYKQIAKQLGTSPSTVHAWFKGTTKTRERAARHTLQRQEEEQTIEQGVANAGEELAEAYSMAERMGEVLGAAHNEATDPSVRKELSRAQSFYQAMRDSIVGALGAEPQKRPPDSEEPRG